MLKMDKFESFSGRFIWLIVLVLGVLAASCARHERALDATVSKSDTGVRSSPAVIDTNPMAISPMVTDVPLHSNISATFNRDMDPATISPSTFKVACPNGTAIEGTVSYTPSSRMVSFTPIGGLPPNTICTAAVTTGAQDAVGSPLERLFVWTFMTGQM
jgi:hypothetical protein